MGTDGPVSVNQIAIYEAMDLYDVADRRGCFEKVVNVARTMIREDRESRS